MGVAALRSVIEKRVGRVDDCRGYFRFQTLNERASGVGTGRAKEEMMILVTEERLRKMDE